MLANDTSVAVGYAPLSETEMLVLSAERWLNAAAKEQFPETGEDVKVMGVRRGRRLHLTMAVAFVDRFVADEATYFERIEKLRGALQHHLDAELTHLDGVEIHINTLDQPGRGVEGMYLTVLGTSAESGDGGQVGRGNPVNGVISLNRPTSNEAAAGKNPVSHVGKIYSLLSFCIAGKICEALEGVDEAYVWLCSQIGRPVDAPWFASVNVILAPDALLSDVSEDIRAIAHDELGRIPQFIDRLVQGEFPVC
jgi:S-adenosylmethionine synthetase